MKLSVLHAQAPYKAARTYRQFDLDGIPTIGVVPGEEYQVKFAANGRRTQVVFSIDGINPLTGKQAELGANQSSRIIEPGSSTILSHWTEDAHGGGALVFADPKHTAANYVGDEPEPIGCISVAVYVESEVSPRMPKNFPDTLLGHDDAYRMPNIPIGGGRFDGPRDAVARRSYEPSPMFGEQLRGPSDVSSRSVEQVGTGVGRRIESISIPVSGLVKPAFAGVFRVRYLNLAVLRDKLPKHPLGFKLPAVADLGSVPRMDEAEGQASGPFAGNDYIHPGVLRFETAML